LQPDQLVFLREVVAAATACTGIADAGVAACVITGKSSILCVRRGERLYNVNVVFSRAFL